MDIENIISFIPVNSDDNNQRTFTSALASMFQSNHTQNYPIPPPLSYTLDNFKFESTIDTDSLNIKTFSEKFKDIKMKLTNIETIILELEKKKDKLKSSHDEICKKLIEIFGFSPSNDIFAMITNKAHQLIANLELEKYYEERNNLLKYYTIAIPLLEEVKKEFFSDKQTLSNCTICYEKNISYAMYPCGHTLCSECKKKLTNNCFQCRANIIRVNKIYV